MNWVAIQCHMTTTNSTTTINAGEYMINCIATMATVIHYYRGYLRFLDYAFDDEAFEISTK